MAGSWPVNTESVGISNDVDTEMTQFTDDFVKCMELVYVRLCLLDLLWRHEQY